MEQLQILIYFLLFANATCTQVHQNQKKLEINSELPDNKIHFINYVNSFKEATSAVIIESIQIVRVSNQMTKNEALSYVYNGDSTKLYCNFPNFNMETEKIEGISTELLLPSKCLRVVKDNYLVIANSFFQCQSPNELLKTFLSITILNKEFTVMDTLIIYKGNEYDSYINGLINIKNGKIFLYGKINNNHKNDVIIFQINNSTLKIETIETIYGVDGDIDNLISTLKMINKFDYFMN